MNKQIRMLAGIMFTDIVGYTAMMQENEKLARTLRDKHKQVLERVVFEHQGQILQYYGDGTLSIFGSVIEAVNAAIRIQQELQQKPVIPIRIGIHLGDVVYDDEGVFGDGVNVASRIESLAVGGSVLISDKVNDELKNQKSIHSLFLGSFELKNVKDPVKVYAVEADGIVIPDPTLIRGKKVDKKKSIAVLPFVNMSPDPENEYFSDGITEEILNALSKVDGLLVTSRTSSFAFKGTRKDIREIGKQLGVQSVLEGSVRKQGNKVRITAQLITTNDGYHQWSETYDRDLEDIFKVQDEISRTIAKKMREKLTAEEGHAPMIKTPTKNMEVYNIFLRGRFYWNKWNPESVKKAVELFREAIEIEPEFAYPYAALATCYVFMGATGILRPKEAYPLAKSYALKTMEIDSELAASHYSLALVKLFYEWDFKEAELEFRKAVSLSPGSADVHHVFYLFYLSQGKKELALEEIQLAYNQDPFNLPIIVTLSEGYFFNENYSESLRIANTALEIDPTFRLALYIKAWALFALGKIDDAISTVKHAQNLAGSELKAVTQLGILYAKSGRLKEAKDYLRKLKIRSVSEKDTSLNLDFALFYFALEENDKAFEYLEKAFEERLGGLIFIHQNPQYKKLFENDRFIDLMRRVGVYNENS
ncbi:MAG: guanylate cyclase [Ignavibacteriaceae bacterium]|nr:guanylate cyclase [Ignavibacteriaceae bacterium]